MNRAINYLYLSLCLIYLVSFILDWVGHEKIAVISIQIAFVLNLIFIGWGCIIGFKKPSALNQPIDLAGMFKFRYKK